MNKEDWGYFLLQISPLSPKRALKLINKFGSAEEIFNLDESLLEKNLKPKTLKKFLSFKSNYKKESLKILNDCKKLNLKIITLNSYNYPDLLKNIYDPPLCLFVEGSLPSPDQFPIGIVGSRKASSYAKNQAKNFSSSLSSFGFVIVSGIAYGIDTSAHEGCISKSRASIGILAGGHNCRTAREKTLSKRIIESGGAIISEHPPNTTPLKHLFPYRNRIISGMTRALIVAEAAEKSGSLVTAQLAAEQNRDLFAIPGSIENPNTKGVHHLIQEGAFCLTDTKEILDYYSITSSTASKNIPAEITSTFTKKEMSIAELEKSTNLTTKDLLAKLSDWELDDYIEKTDNDCYKIKLY